jgi:acetolactate synthase-1/3 small subunit
MLTITVANEPGALARIAGLFAHLRLNIVSLVARPCDDERFSLITAVVEGDRMPINQIVVKLNGLIPVVEAVAGNRSAPSMSSRLS